MGIEESIGKKILEARRSKGLTLNQLSKLSNISVSTLSKIENARVSSPLAVYSNIANALQVSLGELFSETEKDPISVVRKEEYKTVTKVPNYIGKAIAFKKFNKKIEPFIHFYQPNISKPIKYRHDNEELIFVLEGELEFNYGETTYVLNEGDCVYYDAEIEHSVKALGSTAATALVVQA